MPVPRNCRLQRSPRSFQPARQRRRRLEWNESGALARENFWRASGFLSCNEAGMFTHSTHRKMQCFAYDSFLSFARELFSGRSRNECHGISTFDNCNEPLSADIVDVGDFYAGLMLF